MTVPPGTIPSGTFSGQTVHHLVHGAVASHHDYDIGGPGQLLRDVPSLPRGVGAAHGHGEVSRAQACRGAFGDGGCFTASGRGVHHEAQIYHRVPTASGSAGLVAETGGKTSARPPVGPGAREA